MELYETIRFIAAVLSVDLWVVLACDAAVKITKAVCGRMVFKNTHIANMEINRRNADEMD